MSMMNLSHLAVFHAVATEGSVSRAAERLMVSQPAVSKQLRDFERSLGTPLFDRLPKGVRPTAAGELLAGYARRIFALEAEAGQALAELRGLRRGRLSVGASTTIGVYLLPEVFVRFRQAYPGIAMHLEIASSEVIRQRLADGAIDVGLTEGEVDADGGFESPIFMEDELVAIAPPGHPLTRRPDVPAADLCREPFVVRETGSGTKSLVERALAGRGLSVRPVMSLGSTEAIKRAVAAGVGVAIVSRLTVGLELQVGRLALVRLSDLTLRRPMHRVGLRGRHESRAVGEFMRLLREGTKVEERCMQNDER
jgi:DNA-binding transcriptional LysR family regulator